MSDVVGSAWVELRAELDRFDKEVKSGAESALDRVGVAAKDAGNDVERALSTAAVAAKADLERIGDGMTDVESEARSAGADIERAMKSAADASEQAFSGAADEIAEDMKDAGDRGGDGFEGGFSGKALAGIVAFGAAAAKILTEAFSAAGELIGEAFGSALEAQNMPAMIEAQLNVPPQFAADLGEAASSLYRDAWGESLAEVQENLVNAQQSVGRYGEVGVAELERITEKAYQMAGVFDTDVGQSIEQAGMLFRTGLADSGEEALDLLAAAMQQVPVSLREELFEATNEYSQFFAALGLTGAESMALLVAASEDGVYGIDKMGDAIKEFTIRSTDMSASTKTAFDAIGLDMETLTNDLLAGGDTSREAFQQIIDGLLAIEDPGQQAAAAIALFGTPLEDLGTSEIPEFLAGLSDVETGLLNVEGVGDQMANATSTWQSSLESFRRKAMGGLSDFIQNNVLPILQGFGAWWNANLPQIQAIWQNVVNAIVTAWTTYGQPLFAVISEAFNSIVLIVQQNWPQISATVQQVMTTVSLVLQTAVEIITFLWNTFGENIIERVRIAFTFVMNTIQAVMTIVQGIINTVMGLITGDWSRAWEGIQQIFTGIWDLISGYVTMVLDTIRNTVSTVMNAIQAVFGGAWNAILSTITAIGQNIINAIRNAWNTAYSTTTSLVGNIVSFIAGIPGRAGTALLSFGSTILSKVKSGFDSIISGLPGWIADIVSTVGEIPGKIVTALGDVASSVGDAFLGMLKSAYNGAVGAVNDFLPNSIPLPGPIPDIPLPANPLPHWNKYGGIFDRPTLRPEGFGEAGAEAVVPLTRPGYMDRIMDDSGMTARALERFGSASRGGYGGPLVSFPGAVIQDATDVEKVAQRTMAAYRTRMVKAS